jgi:hypothetical protein
VPHSIIGEKRNAYRVLWGNQKARDHLEDLDVDGRINVVRILKEQDGRTWNGFM